MNGEVPMWTGGGDRTTLHTREEAYSHQIVADLNFVTHSNSNETIGYAEYNKTIDNYIVLTYIGMRPQARAYASSLKVDAPSLPA